MIRLGYTGLPTAALLATKGYSLRGVDILDTLISTINKGEIHIVEPDLDVFVKSAVQSGNLSTSKLIHDSDMFSVAAPKPLKANNEPDLTYVFSACKSLLPVL